MEKKTTKWDTKKGITSFVNTYTGPVSAVGKAMQKAAGQDA